jgi:hypothetical protein
VFGQDVCRFDFGVDSSMMGIGGGDNRPIPWLLRNASDSFPSAITMCWMKGLVKFLVWRMQCYSSSSELMPCVESRLQLWSPWGIFYLLGCCRQSGYTTSSSSSITLPVSSTSRSMHTSALLVVSSGGYRMDVPSHNDAQLLGVRRCGGGRRRVPPFAPSCWR